MTLIEAAKQALEALEKCMYPQLKQLNAITALRTALRTVIATAEKQEPVAWKNAAIRLGEELSSVGPDGYYNMTAAQWLDWAMDQQPRGKNSLTTPPAAQRQPLIDSVRQMRDVQGMDGTWNCDPYMHGLYNGLEFAVSLLEQREPQFKDAPEKWLSDLPKPRIFSATEAAHGIKEKNK